MLERQGERAEPPVPGLVARIAAGDREAESIFVQRYQRGVTALVRRHCRPNDPEVSDLVQEVLSSVLLRLREGALREADSLAAYLQVTVVRTTTAEYRRRAMREPSGETVQSEVDDDSAQPLDLDRLRQARAVRELIAQLPTPRDREILRRFYLEEQSKADVCGALSIEPAHFHRVVFRARQRLGELLERAGIAGETNRRVETPA